jgi:broad specificity phosphatase PhoE
MKVLFVRHGEPNYQNVGNLNLVSYLGELTSAGLQQAEKVAVQPELYEAEIIIASPFTRALQTASIISRIKGLPIYVEPGLHEWLCDKSHQQTLNTEYSTNSYREFVEHNGVRVDSCNYNWESAEEIAARAYPVIEKYRAMGYSKIIVVAHAMLIRTFGYAEQEFPYCGIYPMEFTKYTKYNGFVPWNG